MYFYHSTISLNKHSNFSNKMRAFLLAVSCFTFHLISLLRWKHRNFCGFSKVSDVTFFKNQIGNFSYLKSKFVTRSLDLQLQRFIGYDKNETAYIYESLNFRMFPDLRGFPKNGFFLTKYWNV